VKYQLCAFAYSNIGNGCLFEVNWGSKSFIPMNEDSSSDSGSHTDDDYNETDEEMGFIKSKSNNDTSVASDVCSWCSEQSEELHEHLLDLEDDREGQDLESVSSVESDSDSNSDSEPESEGNINHSFCDTPTTYD
jgi:hypothetical protein